jgi:hypothetical protein
MTSAAGFQLLAQSLGQVRFLLTKLDDQIQAGLAADPHNKFLLDFEDTVTNRILETNHAIQQAYARGTLLSGDESALSHQHAVQGSQSGERTFSSAA